MAWYHLGLSATGIALTARWATGDFTANISHGLVGLGPFWLLAWGAHVTKE
jgi:hypothetical protein